MRELTMDEVGEVSGGNIADAANSAIGPPRIIPTVAARNMMIAFNPNCLIPLKSILKQSRISEAGSKYLEATKYRFESSPDIIPKGQFNRPGMK